MVDYLNSLSAYWRYVVESALVAGVFFVVALAIGFAFRVYAQRWGGWLGQSVVRHLRPAFRWWLPALAAAVYTGRLEADAVRGLALGWRVVLFLLTGWLLLRLGRVFADVVRHEYDIAVDDNLRQRKVLTQLTYIQRLWTVSVAIFTLALVLMQFDGIRELGAGLLTSAGIVGIVIGIAAQRSLANLLAGLQIAFTQPLRLDDAVVIDGEFGWVEEITLTYVTVKLWDLRRQVVPLNRIIEQPFQNWTRERAALLGTVLLYTDPRMPIAPLRTFFEAWLATQALYTGEAQAVQLTNTSAEALEIRFLMSAASAPKAFDLRCAAREALVTFMQTEYPQYLPHTRVSVDPPADPPTRTAPGQQSGPRPV